MALDGRLILDASLATAIASLYAYVGNLVLQRPLADADARLANRAFATWWFALATTTGLGGARSFLLASGQADLVLHKTLAFVGILPLAVALAGLLYYLLYVHTGRRAWFWPVVVLHGAMYVFFMGVVVFLDPVGAESDGWRATVAYARPLDGPLQTVTMLVLVGPVIAAALAYFTLIFRTRDRTTRFRIGTIALAFAGWFGITLVGSLLDVPERVDWWPPATRAVALFATLLVVAAFRPPAWLRARLSLDAGAT